MYKVKMYVLFFFLCVNLVGLSAQQDLSKLSWHKVSTGMPAEWYGTEQAANIADTVLHYQTAIGGWPKNVGFHKHVNQEEMARVRKSGIGATFDNGLRSLKCDSWPRYIPAGKTKDIAMPS